MARARKKNVFGWLTEKKVTYKRSVPKASKRRKATVDDEKPATWTREDAEKALKRWKRLGYNPTSNIVDNNTFVGNVLDRGPWLLYPAESAPQYRLAQAVLSGTAKLKGMSKKAAQEIVDRTPAKLRSTFMRSNPEDAAAELSEAWHGRPARTASDIIETGSEICSTLRPGDRLTGPLLRLASLSAGRFTAGRNRNATPGAWYGA